MKKITKTFVALFVVFVLVATMACAVACENDPCKDGHTASLVRGTAATCTEGGTQDYYKCAVCNKLFSDEACQNEIQDPIPTQPLGHDTGNWLYNDTQHYKFCDRCSSKLEAADHIYGTDNKCTVCQYSKPVEEEKAAPLPAGIFVPVSSPVAGEYYMGMKVDSDYWFATGEMAQTYYFATSKTEAVKITLVEDGDGWLIKKGEKFIEITLTSNDKGDHINVEFHDAQTTGKNWKWNDDEKVFVWDDAYIIGNTGTYNNISGLKLSQKASNHFAVLGKFDVNAHEHTLTYPQEGSNWQHIESCTDPQCPDSYTNQTAQCTPVLNVCPCGKEYTAAEIVAHFFEDGITSLPGTYKLTGVVKEFAPDGEYTDQYKNVTVIVTVEGHDITAFRMKNNRDEFEVGEGVAVLKVGDTITFSGTLTVYDGQHEMSPCTLEALTPGEGGGGSQGGGDTDPEGVKTFELTTDSLQVPKKAYVLEEKEVTIKDVKFVSFAVADYGDGLQMRTNSGNVSSFWSGENLGGRITKIEIVWNSSKHSTSKADMLKVELGTNLMFDVETKNVGYTVGEDTVIDVDQHVAFVRFSHNNNGGVYINSVKITIDTTVSVQTTPMPHSCESVCLVCGKCYNTSCQETACTDKCEGHGIANTPLYTLNPMDPDSQTTNNGYAGSGTVTINNVQWTVEGNGQINPWRLGGKGTNQVVRKVTGNNAITGKVAKILVQFTDAKCTVDKVELKVYSGDPASSAAIATKAIPFEKNSKVLVDSEGADWTNCYYELVFTITLTSSGSNTYVCVPRLDFFAAA